MSMTTGSALFVDTNILIYASDPASSWHNAAISAVYQARQQRLQLCLSPQVIREYISAASRSMNLQADILSNVSLFQSECRVVEENSAVLDRLVALVEQFQVAGKQVHDANIVATMLENNIGTLLTGNVADFKRYANLIAIVPLM